MIHIHGFPTGLREYPDGITRQPLLHFFLVFRRHDEKDAPFTFPKRREILIVNKSFWGIRITRAEFQVAPGYVPQQHAPEGTQGNVGCDANVPLDLMFSKCANPECENSFDCQRDPCGRPPLRCLRVSCIL